MNTFQLEAFRTIARCLSYTRAAKELFVSQPYLSKTIAALEDELNVALFARRGNTIKLTEAGLLFLESSEFMIDEYARLKNELALSLRLRRNSLSLALDQNAAYANVHEHIERFMEQAPGCQIKIHETTFSRLLDLLDALKADVAIGWLHDQSANRGYAFHTLSSGSWKLLMSKSNPLSVNDCIGWPQAKELDFIFPSNNAHFKNMVLLCQRNGFYPRIKYYSFSMHNVEDTVRRNFGVALVPGSLYLAKVPDDMKLLRLVPEIPETFSIAYRKGDNSPIVKQFVDFCVSSFAASADRCLKKPFAGARV